MLKHPCRPQAGRRAWAALMALCVVGVCGLLAPGPLPTARGQVPPTPPFPTLAPTDPFPTLPPNVPTPSQFTATATRAVGPSPTPTPRREASPTAPPPSPSLSPSPPFDLEVPLVLPYLGLNHLALDPQALGRVRRDAAPP